MKNRIIDRIIISIPEYDGPGIYKIENLTNGKVYIGSSKNIKQRILSHDSSFRNRSVHCNYKFYEDIEKGHKFKAEVLEKCRNMAFYELRDREEYYVKKYNSFKTGYNSEPVITYDPYDYSWSNEVLNWLFEKM